ncbi:MAG: glycosyltransferase, partial [Spiribacter salinus]
RVIRMPENGGAYVARNAGLDAATGTYVTIHDADDWSHPAKIETQVRFMEGNGAVMGCTSQQARATSELAFTRWTGLGSFTITNTSSFMFRRAPMREQLGYWDTVRFSADNELIRRMQKLWGGNTVRHLSKGPFSFQRDGESSIIADDAIGINGFLFGARREYYDAQRRHHATTRALKYPKTGHLFPTPAIMHPDRRPKDAPREHLPCIVGSDFRMPGGSVQSCLEELRAMRTAGLPTAVLEMNRYDVNFGGLMRSHMLEDIRDELTSLSTRIITYGERVTCDLLLLRYPPILQHRQRYVPDIDARDIRVIVNQPPMSDYTAEGVLRYDLADCAENIRHYFGKDATWHPIGPLVRDALTTHHADQLHHIHLADEDWHNIIDIKGWSPGPRTRGPGDKLRIGRHSRDSWHKWPASRDDIRAAYPGGDDVEVHVLGGAETPRAVLGAIPANWTVHDFGAMHPKDFLAGIDVWIYFAHPDWVESFGRTIIEAMAVGVPVILPEVYRPLFQDAALYATPQTAVEIARKLHADPATYDAQAEKARCYVAEEFSYDMHMKRLNDLGVLIDA